MRRYVFLGLLALVAFGAGIGVSLWHQSLGRFDSQAPDGVMQMSVDLKARAEQKMQDAIREIQEDSQKQGGILADSPPPPVAPAPQATEEAAPKVAGVQIGSRFELTSHDGVTLNQESFGDKYMLVFFGFTHCPDICPTTLDKLTTVFDTTPELAEKAQVLFVTVDPARDDVAVMKDYVSNYHSSFIGLTGTEDEVKEAVDAFRVYAAKGEENDGGYLMDHSAFIYVMSPQSELLGVIRSDVSADEMAKEMNEKMTATPTSPAGE